MYETKKAIKQTKRRLKFIKFITPKSWHKSIINATKNKIIYKFGTEIGNAIINELLVNEEKNNEEIRNN